MSRLESVWDLFGPLMKRTWTGKEDGSLEFVCRVMQRAVPHCHPPTFLIASLLSSVMTANRHQEGIRDQIHILLTCRGQDPYTLQLLSETAEMLSPINSLCRLVKDGSFCEVRAARKGDPDGISAGHLALSRMGISVLDLDRMSRSEKRSCAMYLRSSRHLPCPGAEGNVPVTSTLWATAQSHPTTEAGTPDMPTPFGEEFRNLFDIVVPFSVQNDTLYDAHVIRRLLRSHTNNSSVIILSDGCCVVGPVSAIDSDARHQIRCLVKRSMEFAVPKMSREAAKLLEGYYTYVRNPRVFHEPAQVQCVPVHVFHSLLRLASASARLTLSPIIRTVPDVTLAIKLTEETLLESVNQAAHWWHILQVCFCVGHHESAQSIDAQYGKHLSSVSLSLTRCRTGRHSRDAAETTASLFC